MDKVEMALEDLYFQKRAVIGIIGLGYVGIPLALAALNSGFNVVGFDIDQKKVDAINAGISYLKHIPTEVISKYVALGKLKATFDYSAIKTVDAIIICVPTPLTAYREPDLTFVENTTTAIAPYLRPGHLIVLESTTWPGTTDEVVRPILEQNGMISGQDFYLAFSPEREDPGNPNYSIHAIPKVVGADDSVAQAMAEALYSSIAPQIISVSSTRTAEAVKLTENIFRAVNIALVNELKVVYEAMGINIWEVIDAAKTKPFGFMPFYPGPGLGGHCIPIDPFYLAWKAREHEISTRFIELAGEINTAMPSLVVEKLAQALDVVSRRGLRDTKILIVGMAYKKNVDDIRGSPALKIMDILVKRGADVSYFDPHIRQIPFTREYPAYGRQESIGWNIDLLKAFDAALIVTDHDDVDYEALCRYVPLVVDTRNVCRRNGISQSNVSMA
jgi:UDP-N-acetyl-D-glucosamine dehydrogenase